MKELSRKRLLLTGLGFLVGASILIGVTIDANSYFGQPWPKDSCKEQFLAIAEQRPWVTAMCGEISEGNGCGRLHVQAFDSRVNAWLRIDRWNRISEHKEWQYPMKYVGKYSAKVYRWRYEYNKK